jgi:hypothetical protein
MKTLILAAALTLAAVPAVAQSYRPSINNPNNPNNTGGLESAYDAEYDRHADAREYDRYVQERERYADERWRERRDARDLRDRDDVPDRY